MNLNPVFITAKVVSAFIFLLYTHSESTYITKMDDEYPNPDEEFELMHAEEMEILNEVDSCEYG